MVSRNERFVQRRKQCSGSHVPARYRKRVTTPRPLFGVQICKESIKEALIYRAEETTSQKPTFSVPSRPTSLVIWRAPPPEHAGQRQGQIDTADAVLDVPRGTQKTRSKCCNGCNMYASCRTRAAFRRWSRTERCGDMTALVNMLNPTAATQQRYEPALHVHPFPASIAPVPEFQLQMTVRDQSRTSCNLCSESHRVNSVPTRHLAHPRRIFADPDSVSCIELFYPPNLAFACSLFNWHRNHGF